MSESNINLNMNIDKSLKGLTPEAVENVAEAQYKGYWGFVNKHPWIKYVYIVFGLVIVAGILFFTYNALTFKSRWKKIKEETHEFVKERDEEIERSRAEHDAEVKEMRDDFNNNVEKMNDKYDAKDKEMKEDFNDKVNEVGENTENRGKEMEKDFNDFKDSLEGR